MLNLANTFAALPDHNAADFSVDLGDFSATSATFTPKTDAARARFPGVASFTTRKSDAPQMAADLGAEGFKVS